jgi:hypothetical protein
MTTRTLVAADARPDPSNNFPSIVVPDGTCLAVDDGDTSYAEAYPGQSFSSLALVGGTVLWTPSSPVRWTRIDSAQIVVIARYLSGSDVRLQAGWTDPAFLTNTRAYGAFTGPALTAGYATYTAPVGTTGMLTTGGPDLSGIVGYVAVDDLAGDSARFTYAALIVTGVTTGGGVRQRQIPGNVRQRQVPGIVRQRQNSR